MKFSLKALLANAYIISLYTPRMDRIQRLKELGDKCTNIT